jgi:hypothetical protein
MDNRFSVLPASSRIWIYQANRKLSENEKVEITEKANRFVVTWSAHGSELEAGAIILYNRFLLLGVNEDQTTASGCSIDKSLRFIQKLEKDYDISFLERSKVAFFIDKEVELFSLGELKFEIDAGTITKDTLIFNNLVVSKGDLDDKWIIPANDSWVKKYFLTN